MEKKKIKIIYYNVEIILIIENENDEINLQYLMDNINQMHLKDIYRWCNLHSIKYKSRFHFRKNYLLSENIWNLYSYIRTLIEI